MLVPVFVSFIRRIYCFMLIHGYYLYHLNFIIISLSLELHICCTGLPQNVIQKDK
jgi:hypothetical protein